MNELQCIVSIVLPTHNGEKFLQKSIESCLHQTYPYFELIIVNDGSTDRTKEIIDSFKDDRIKPIHLTKNEGIVNALNKGFSQAKGDFLTWTSDDNYYASHAIGYMINYLQNNRKIDFVYAKYNVINEQGEIIREGNVKPPKDFDFDNYVGGCFLYRRKVYEKIGEFHHDAFLVEDYEYWLRVREHFKMKMLSVKLYYYRQHEQSLTSIHTEQKVHSQVQRIREQYASIGRVNYFKAQKAFAIKDYDSAKKFILHSLLKDPFYCESWRIFFHVYLPKKFIMFLRALFKKG